MSTGSSSILLVSVGLVAELSGEVIFPLLGVGICGAVPFIRVFDRLFLKIIGPKPVPSDVLGFVSNSVGLSILEPVLEDFCLGSESPWGELEPLSGLMRFTSSESNSSMRFIF